MIEPLTAEGYEQTKEKLLKLQERLDSLERRRDLNAQHQNEVRRSYNQMISQYRREMKLYEAAHPEVLANS